MNNETPKKRARNPHLRNVDRISVQSADKGDAPLDCTRERKGRPERSPSLPPGDPKTDNDKPAA
ncbi:MAG TPA: hypothetical protein VGE74_15730 [Gemmata sp.]